MRLPTRVYDRPELSQSRAESGHNSMCQNGLKILLRAIVRHLNIGEHYGHVRFSYPPGVY